MQKKNSNTQIYIWIILATLQGTCILSCNKFLSKKSNSTLVTPSTISELQRLLDDTNLMNEKATPSFGETSADDYFLPNKTYNSLPIAYHKIYTWQYFDIGSGNDWSQAYTKVYNANFCLEMIKKINRTNKNQTAWNNVKGSALYFRAYYYLNLAWNYAKAYNTKTASKDLGIVLRQTSDYNIPSVRASVEQTYKKIIQDTKISIKYLPKYPIVLTRPSKMAAYGLLARTYLSMRDYPNALLYADSCLNLNDQLINYNEDNDIVNDINENVPFKQLNKETIFYTEMNNSLGLHRTTIRSRIDTILFTKYNDHDLRKKAFFTQNQDGYEMFKANYSGDINKLFTGIATDEMYLIRSECNIRVFDTQKGLNDLNTLLMNRWEKGYYKSYKNLSDEKALDIVLSERRKELLMRGLRWMDIKRLNMGGRNIIIKRIENEKTFTLNPNANYYALPLPEDIIRITGMPQNPF